jgi:hypothetical protein
MQLDRNLEELNEYRRKLDLSARDHKRLQDDLLTVTRENQVRIKKKVSRFFGATIRFELKTPLRVSRVQFEFRPIKDRTRQALFQTSCFFSRHFIKNLNMLLMIKKILNYKFKNILKKYLNVKMLLHKR